MKRLNTLFALLACVSIFFAGCGRAAEAPAIPQEPTQEIRAVWISYLELTLQEDERSEESFRAMAKEMTERIKDGKMNTVFLHVRPFSDALYRSDLFPVSACLTGSEGTDPGFDALEIFCEYADEAGLSLHAWINPFRIGSASGLDSRSDDNPAKRLLCDGDPDNDARIVAYDGTLYYDPADADNQDLIADGVRELLQKYPIDGIHIDDYFYPTTDPSVDRKDYDAYLAQGGTDGLDDWRRTQINTLVARLYTCVKSFGQDKIFSISPALDPEKNRSEFYADVARWAAYAGYCDWLIPQIYVGFTHETYPFNTAARQWTQLKRCADVRLLFGLAAYKCGAEDVYAGSGRSEWIDNADILPRQIRFIHDSADISGFAFFSYAYAFGEKMSDNSISEMKSVISML